MILTYEARLSDSPYVESVSHGWTQHGYHGMRPAEMNWHMVFVRLEGMTFPIITGPWSYAGMMPFVDAEIIWVRFKLGVFMPHLPVRDYLNNELILPGASDTSFWLNSEARELPQFENVETFVNRLIHDETLKYDPLIADTLQNHPHDLSPRTIRHRFVQATGMSQKHIQQINRAKQARDLLQQGQSILDTAFESGYYDQSHMTRSLKQYLGYTPMQLIEMSAFT